MTCKKLSTFNAWSLLLGSSVAHGVVGSIFGSRSNSSETSDSGSDEWDI